MESTYWRSIDLLDAAGADSAASGRPFVAAGDFNMPPAELRKTNLLAMIHGEIVAQDEWTCRLNGVESVIDYFIVPTAMLSVRVHCGKSVVSSC